MLQKKRTLNDLQHAEQFATRHVGPSIDDQQAMLSLLDCNNLQQLIAVSYTHLTLPTKA